MLVAYPTQIQANCVPERALSKPFFAYSMRTLCKAAIAGDPVYQERKMARSSSRCEQRHEKVTSRMLIYITLLLV